MTVPAIVDNFMSTLARSIQEIAIIQLFHCPPAVCTLRLALDYAIPIINDDKVYELQLVARVTSLGDDDMYRTKPVVIKGTYNLQTHIMPGPSEWEIPTSSLAHQLVAALKLHVDKLTKPNYMQIIKGNTVAIQPHMKRIWIK